MGIRRLHAGRRHLSCGGTNDNGYGLFTRVYRLWVLNTVSFVSWICFYGTWRDW